MPRVRPPEPLIVRSIRMSEKAWAELDRLGGAQWIRNQLKIRAALAHNVKTALVAKKPHREIAKEWGISTKTIQNIWKGLL